MGEVRTKEQFAKYDEALTTTLRRLIGSSVVVGPASRSRRHEGPSRMAVSRRSGKSRPPRWAARLQARVGSGSASPPPARADEPGQHTVSSASLAWRALCLLADVPMLPGWDASGRGHWAQLRRDPRPLPHRAGERDPKRCAGASGARAVGGPWPPTGGPSGGPGGWLALSAWSLHGLGPGLVRRWSPAREEGARSAGDHRVRPRGAIVRARRFPGQLDRSLGGRSRLPWFGRGNDLVT